MKTFSKQQMKTFKQVASLRQPALFKMMRQFLGSKYKHVYGGFDQNKQYSYMYAEGTIPIALIAHMDTVFPNPPKQIYFDRDKNVLWSPQGLGADDRAGVFAIIDIIQSGLRPHIILTADEEKGGLGAAALIGNNYKSPFKDLRYLIQLDRQGENDCVFYDCDNPLFTDYIEDFGFVEAIGTFSDISYICPDWKVAGVNLSVGYKREHTVAETLHVGHLLSTIEKVKQMLTVENLPAKFEYIPFEWDNRMFGIEDGYLARITRKMMPESPNRCCVCGYVGNVESLFPVLGADGKHHSYCSDCIILDGINWCSNCYQPYEVSSINDRGICYDCAKKLLKVETT